MIDDSVPPAQSPSAPRQTLVVRNVSVVSMLRDTVRSQQAVVIEGGTLAAVVPDAGHVPHANATIIDGVGAHVLPGLADMHVHPMHESDLLLYPAHGVTTVRIMWGAPTHLDWRRRVDSGEMLGPRLVVASPLIDGIDVDGLPVWPGSGVLTQPGGAAPLVRSHAAAGYEQIKTYALLQPDVLRAVGRAASECGLRLVGHCPDAMPLDDAVAAGMTCFEHLTGFDVSTGADVEEARRTGARLAAQQVWSCPTLTVFDGRRRLLEGTTGDGRLSMMPERVLEGWRRFAPPPADEWRPARLADARRRQQRRRAIVAALRQEGAPLLAGTDANNPYVFPGSSLPEELANFVAAGLTPFEALRTATVAAAEFLGEPGAWGVIAPGARADLVLVRGNPLADIAALRRIEGVVCRGRYFDRDALDGLLRARAAAVASQAALTEGEAASTVR